MASIRPFAAVIYAPPADGDISSRIAPPYDVVDAQMRDALLRRDAHNIVAIDLPQGPADPDEPGNRYESAARLWRRWLHEGVLVQAETPAIYVLKQSWDHDGRTVSRRAFMAAVRIHRFEEGVIIPHERTLPKAVADRLALTRACATCLSPVFGLFSDPAGEADAFFDETARGASILHATGPDGVESRLWAIHDPHALAAIERIFADKRIFIADGHHRYTVAVAYRDERRAADAAAGVVRDDPPYDYVLMALVNMDDPDLVVMATHRIARAQGPFDAEAFWSALSERFDVVPSSGPWHAALEEAPRPAFLVKTRDGDARLAVLKPSVDLDVEIPVEASAGWKHLDVTVLQELVLRPLLGIHPDEPETLERLSFVKDTRRALEVPEGDVAFILRPTRMDQLKAVALAGDTMPQKSTYFHPKLPTGLLFYPLD